MTKARAAGLVLGAVASTWRIREEIPPECAPILRGESTAVIAFWHSQMLPMWYALRKLHPAAIVSPSNDGGMLAAWLGSLGYGAVLRGSSSRGGSAALSASVEQLRSRSVLVTPDGPRGPARQAKPGALLAALRAGVPLVVAGWSCERAIRFRSWDRMEAPLPVARVDVRYELFDMTGLSVDRRLHDEDLARLSAAIDRVSGRE
jgi:lysophospholipid acyltransferase (LPLAT)-like uncharacterized protein